MVKAIWINIISSTGERFGLRVSADLRIGKFKDLLARSLYARFKENEMKLIFKGDILEDDRTVDSYGLQSDHAIYVEGAHSLAFIDTTDDTSTGMPDTSQLIPVITMMMQSLLSSSLYMKQVIGHNPQLQSIFDSNPQLRAMMQNPDPEVFCRLTSPQMMQERLARPEAAFATTKVADSGNVELSNKVVELERRLEEAKSEQLAEREKALKEEEKLRYRITHLLRALEKAESNVASE
ncbi:ubiquitin family protein [Tanacetum coccineum]